MRSRALPCCSAIVLFSMLAALPTACAGPEAFTVVVDVTTDYGPGVQFDTVVVTLASDADGTRRSELETVVTTETDEAGFRAAAFEAIPSGFHRLEVRLLDAGAEVASQRLTVAVFSATAVTAPGSVSHREMVVSGDYILLRATLTGEHDFGGGVRTGDASPWAVVLRD